MRFSDPKAIDVLFASLPNPTVEDGISIIVMEPKKSEVYFAVIAIFFSVKPRIALTRSWPLPSI